MQINQSFKNLYYNIICEDLILKENINNIHEISFLSHISLSHSSKSIAKNSQFAIPALSLLELVCGQKPKLVKTKKSVASFQIRKNQPIGCKITLRSDMLFSFLEKFIFIVLPRLSEFKNKSIQKSSYHFGINQFSSFPEMEGDSEIFQSGSHININTSTNSTSSCRLLLSGFKLLLLYDK